MCLKKSNQLCQILKASKKKTRTKKKVNENRPKVKLILSIFFRMKAQSPKKQANEHILHTKANTSNNHTHLYRGEPPLEQIKQIKYTIYEKKKRSCKGTTVFKSKFQKYYKFKLMKIYIF